MQGVVKRIGFVDGAGCVAVCFMLEGDKNKYIVTSVPSISLTKLGDEVSFEASRGLGKFLESGNVKLKSFRNLTLERELAN